MVRIYDLNKRNVCGVGYIGGIEFSKKTHLLIYKCWYNMIYRCYSQNSLDKYPTYLGCTVGEEFLNFQNFTVWYLENYIYTYVLDKDILIKGNKIYSPNTCCFVPKEINGIFVLSNKIRGKYPIGITLRNGYEVFVTKFGVQKFLGSYHTIDEAFLKYKYEKEQYIRQVADIWKEKISNKVYQALYNYKIEITD